MNRRRADAIVGILVAAVFVAGGTLTWQASQQRQAFDGMDGMMGSSMGAVHGTSPLWVALGTLLVAAVVGGVYALVRPELPVDESGTPGQIPGGTYGSVETDPSADPILEDADTESGRTTPERRLLDLLPDDERRVLEPVLDSPGLTQIELRDRSSFSKSKVSQTVTDLEKRGLLYRERQGRTYRVYPSDELEADALRG